MVEILLILAVVGVALLFPWIGGWEPELLLAVVTGVINLINLAMTAVNLIQAHRQDPRFMRAEVLGSVQILIGVSLLGVFIPTLGERAETWLCGVPFLIGGVIVLVYKQSRTHVKRRSAANEG
ncbi:MAG: hypothetical protein AAGJ81_11175 [Verrucomicrobiota bacterium]